MKNALFEIVSFLVDKPEEVAIEEKSEDGIIYFNVSVAKEDMGRIIGKEGKIIRALRNVMKIPAIKQNLRINISLVEK